jgi:hypothetical protein
MKVFEEEMKGLGLCRNLHDTLVEAATAAINAMGLENFKRNTSFFMSNRDRFPISKEWAD